MTENNEKAMAPWRISNRGDILASSGRGTFIYRNGTRHYLGDTPGQIDFKSLSMNKRGVILGAAYNFSSQYPDSTVSFVLPTSGRKSDLNFADARIVPVPEFLAWDINDDGTMIGWVTAADNTSTPVIYQNGRLDELPGLIPGGRRWGLDINNRGQIAGNATVKDATGHEQFRAVIWSDGRIKDLGLLPGFAGAYCYGINDRGEVVGSCSERLTPDHAFGGFIYRNGIMSVLPTVPGAAANHPVLINNRGDVLIEFWFSPPPESENGYGRYWLYSDGDLVDLSTIVFKALGRVASALIVWDMNDRGEIIGTAQYNDSEQGFLLVPQGGRGDHR